MRLKYLGLNCAWEGGEAPLMPSRRSTAYGLVNQLRDPAIFIDAPGRSEERVYLFYAYGGESGIGVAELDMQKY